MHTTATFTKSKVGDELRLTKEFFDQHCDADPKYILTILRANINVYWSWGTRGLVNLNGKGLRIRVSGIKHKGYVYIVLNGSDLFDVYLTTLQNKIKEILPDVYFDELQLRMDDAIEYTGDRYKQDVDKVKYNL